MEEEKAESLTIPAQVLEWNMDGFLIVFPIALGVVSFHALCLEMSIPCIQYGRFTVR